MRRFGEHPSAYLFTDSNGRNVYIGDRVWARDQLFMATKQGLTRIGSTTVILTLSEAQQQVTSREW